MSMSDYNRTAPISQVDVEEEIIRLLNLLETETEAFEQLAEDAARKESLHKSQWAKAYLTSSGSIKEREAHADWLMTDIAMEYKIAEAMVKSKREKLSSLKTQVDALRTLSANVRAQV